MEDFPGIHTVRIRSKAHINLDPSFEITQRTDDDFDFVSLFRLCKTRKSNLIIVWAGGDDGVSRPTGQGGFSSRPVVAYHRECVGRNPAASPAHPSSLVAGLLQTKAP